tara:strand:- start:432 stop:941 length:510 start_codon:yes stop_codon:yes gene_type:complete
MKPRKSPSPLDGLDAFKKIAEGNRQIAYENKVCKKILKLLFQDDESNYTTWYNRIKHSSEPLLEMQPLFEPYSVRSFRLQSWGFEDLLLRPTKCPVWKEYREMGSEMSEAFPDLNPAVVFYNGALQQDMVIHNNTLAADAIGNFRMTRMSNSGAGGIVIDTLAGFVNSL